QRLSERHRVRRSRAWPGGRPDPERHPERRSARAANPRRARRALRRPGARRGMNRLLIAGCGYVGRALGARLAVEGAEVWGLRRSNSESGDGIQPIAADLADPSTLVNLPADLDGVV